MLEVYHEVRNMFGPEVDYNMPVGADPVRTEVHTSRFQDIFVQFTLVNIGGVRAENTIISVSGAFKRPHGRTLGELFGSIIPQIAPGQSILLLKLDDHELFQNSNDGKQGDFQGTMELEIQYDAPRWTLAWIKSLFGWRRHKLQYLFDPRIVATDLPSPEYT